MAALARRPQPGAGLRRRWRRLAAQPDRGAASVELVVAVPLLLLMLLLVVQTGIWMHAGHIAQSAALRALEAARAEDGSTESGEQAGQHTLAALAGPALHGARVTVTRTATRTTVEVTGIAEAVIPGWGWPVHATATGFNERFVPDTSTQGR